MSPVDVSAFKQMSDDQLAQIITQSQHVDLPNQLNDVSNENSPRKRKKSAPPVKEEEKVKLTRWYKNNKERFNGTELNFCENYILDSDKKNNSEGIIKDVLEIYGNLS